MKLALLRVSCRAHDLFMLALCKSGVIVMQNDITIFDDKLSDFDN